MPIKMALGFSQIGLETVMEVYLLVEGAKVVFVGFFIFAHDDPMMLDSLLDMSIDQSNDRPIPHVASSPHMFITFA